MQELSFRCVLYRALGVSYVELWACLLYRQMQFWQSCGVAASPNLYLGAFSGEMNYLRLTPLMEGKVSQLATSDALLLWRVSSDPSVERWSKCLASRQERGATEIILLPALHSWLATFSPVVRHSLKCGAWRMDLLCSAGASCGADFSKEEQQCPSLPQRWEDAWARPVWV